MVDASPAQFAGLQNRLAELVIRMGIELEDPNLPLEELETVHRASKNVVITLDNLVKARKQGLY